MSHVTQSKYAGPCSFSVTAVIEPGVQMILLFKENQYFFVQELPGLDMCLFCSANAAVRCEKSISVHVNNKATRVQGKWGHSPKASFILAYFEIVQAHLCQTSGFNSPSLRRARHKSNTIPNNKLPSGSRITLVRKCTWCCMG